MAPPPDDHDCGWKKYAEAQAAELALLKEKFDALERRVLGKKSERLKCRSCSRLSNGIHSARNLGEGFGGSWELGRCLRLLEQALFPDPLSGSGFRPEHLPMLEAAS